MATDCETTKRCKRCGETKALTAFYAQPGCSDGRQGTCKACRTVADKAHRQARKARLDRAFPLRLGVAPQPITETIDEVDDLLCQLACAVDRWRSADDRQEQREARAALEYRARRFVGALEG